MRRCLRDRLSCRRTCSDDANHTHSQVVSNVVGSNPKEGKWCARFHMDPEAAVMWSGVNRVACRTCCSGRHARLLEHVAPATDDSTSVMRKAIGGNRWEGGDEWPFCRAWAPPCADSPVRKFGKTRGARRARSRVRRFPVAGTAVVLKEPMFYQPSLLAGSPSTPRREDLWCWWPQH